MLPWLQLSPLKCQLLAKRQYYGYFLAAKVAISPTAPPNTTINRKNPSPQNSVGSANLKNHIYSSTNIIQSQSYQTMDFSKDHNLKRRFTGSTPQQQLKHTPSVTSQATTPRPSKGKVRIEHYQYDEQNKLGEGFTSKVYLARRLDNPKNQFAIKVIDKRRLSKTKQNLELLKQQMLVHGQLDHPNVVKCYQIIEKANFYYFVLEYCSHGTLDAFIKRHTRLAESTTVGIMEQIMSGYKYLLKQKVLHRDLKPPNILKSGPTWKICDFGFSVMGKKSYLGQINVGTPAYMAPQALERTYYSPKTDFFSLGVLCYEMLFGATPWQHKNEKLLLQIMKETNIQDRLAGVRNGSLAKFIRGCCQVNQRNRMAAEEFQKFCFLSEGNEVEKGQFQLSQPLKEKAQPLKEKAKQVGLFTAILSIDKVSTQSSNNASQTTNEVAAKEEQSSRCYSKTSNTSAINLSKNDRKTPPQQAFKVNTAVLQREMYYSTVIYILLKNSHLLLLDQPEQKQLFTVLLSKHASYIIRRIRHRQTNYLCLKRWGQYCAGSTFAKLDAQAASLLHKIQEVVGRELKRRTIGVIRSMNTQFDELTYDKHLSLATIKHLRTYLLQFMNRRVDSYEREGFVRENAWAAEVLEYFMKYFKYLGEVTATTEQSRATAIKREFKDRSELIEDLSQSKKCLQEFQCIKQQLAAIRS